MSYDFGTFLRSVTHLSTPETIQQQPALNALLSAHICRRVVLACFSSRIHLDNQRLLHKISAPRNFDEEKKGGSKSYLQHAPQSSNPVYTEPKLYAHRHDKCVDCSLAGHHQPPDRPFLGCNHLPLQ